MANAKWIVFEGGEGTGKSTIIQWLEARLQQKGIPVISTREPGGTPLAENLRTVLVKNSHVNEDWTPLSEFFIFAASRQQHCQIKIFPNLAKGTWVLCDRFMDSSWVYQGYVGGVRLDLIERVHSELIQNQKPDRILVFDLDAELGLKRAGKRTQGKDENRFENKGLSFHKKVREGYAQLLAKSDVDRRLIDASQSLDEVKKQVVKNLEDLGV